MCRSYKISHKIGRRILLLATLGVLLSACATSEPPEASKANAANVANNANTTNGGKSGIKNAASFESPAVPSAIGGGYQGDGPCPNPPADLDTRADAQPRLEAYLSGPNRPYMALGQRYVPEVSQRAYRQNGKASWYGCKYQGQTTSSGEVFDTYQMTAAHPILPIPSYVRVTNLSNQRSVVVRINDRGPFVANRIIDLSYMAARRIGVVEKGTADVEVERLFPLGSVADSVAQPAPQIVTVIPTLASPTPAPAISPSAASNVQPNLAPAPALILPPTPITQASQANQAIQKPLAVAPLPPQVSNKLVAQTPAQPSVLPAAPQVYLQFGAFVEAPRAEQERARLSQKLQGYPLHIVVHSGLHKIVKGPFASTQAAQQEKAVLQLKKITTFIVAY